MLYRAVLCCAAPPAFLALSPSHRPHTNTTPQEAIAEAEGLDFGAVGAFLFAQNPVEWSQDDA